MKYQRRLNDNKRRNLYKKTEILQCVLRVLYLFKSAVPIKLVIQKKIIYLLFRDSFKGRIKNYCVLTTRSRGIYRDFKVSRILVRSLGAEGLFFGLKKAS